MEWTGGGKLEKNLLEFTRVIAKKTQDSIGDNAKTRAMGLVGCQMGIGPDA